MNLLLKDYKTSKEYDVWDYMLIEEYINNFDSSYIYLERYVNNGSPSGINNTTSESTCPRSDVPSFELRQFDFGEKVRFETIGEANTKIALPHTMIFHPDMVLDPAVEGLISLAIEKSPILVSPTASGRTTKVVGEPAFVKVSYSKLLGRIPRIITKKNIQASCETTDILKTLINKKRVGNQFSILREDSGRLISFENGEKTVEWGVVFREFKPYPYLECNEYLVPFFSLFGKDIHQPDHKPLLIQLFEKQNLPIDDFLLEVVLEPLYRTYFEALIFGGIELEAHAQNMLITINDDFQILRIVCRDLESAGRDIPILKNLNNMVFNSYPYKCNDDTGEPYSNNYSKYTLMHSFMFDFKLGEYITTPIISCASEYYRIDRDRISNELKRFNRQYIKLLPDNFFPKEWCYYKNIIWGEQKREYIWESTPKYRD